MSARAFVRARYGRIPNHWPAQMLADGLSWLFAIWFFALARYDFAIGAFPIRGFVLIAPLAVAIHIAAGRVLRLYRGKYRVGSFEEVTGVVAAAAIAARTASSACATPWMSEKSASRVISAARTRRG